MRAFGIGCFHFSLRKNEKASITVAEYVQEINSTLSKISNISEIDINYDESTATEKLDSSPPYLSLKQHGICYPQVLFLKISFKLYLPYRVQSDVTGYPERIIQTHTENFKVDIISAYWGPVAFIESVNPKKEGNPSTAVQIVRKFLSTSFKSIDTFISFDWIGPSPFHANFFLLKGPEVDEGDDVYLGEKLSFTHSKQPGYDVIRFSYEPNLYKNEQEALAELLDEISEELAFFYFLKMLDAERRNEWSSIDTTLTQLLNFDKIESKDHILKKIFKRPKLIKLLYQDIAQFKGSEIARNSRKNYGYNDLYKSEKYRVYFKFFVDNKIQNSTQYPVAETQELIKYLDERTSKGYALLVTFIAAVAGGLIGAFATILAAK